jgi:hypothetical protein
VFIKYCQRDWWSSRTTSTRKHGGGIRLELWWYIWSPLFFRRWICDFHSIWKVVQNVSFQSVISGNMVVTRSRLFLTNILPSTVHVCEINLFFFSWRALYARVLRVLVRSSLMLTCAKCSSSFRPLLALRILRLVELSRRRTIICLGFGGPFAGLYNLSTWWERIISPSGRSLSTDFTVFLTMSVVFLFPFAPGRFAPIY